MVRSGEHFETSFLRGCFGRRCPDVNRFVVTFPIDSHRPLYIISNRKTNITCILFLCSRIFCMPPSPSMPSSGAFEGQPTTASYSHYPATKLGSSSFSGSASGSASASASASGSGSGSGSSPRAVPILSNAFFQVSKSSESHVSMASW